MLKLLANEQTGLQGIAGLLRTDPGLSAGVLAAANSALYGNPHTIDNLARAILVLGFERTKSLTLTVALRSFLRHPANRPLMEACWRHSVATALLAEEWASLYEVPEDQAYTAGLIHDLGRLGLLMAYSDRYTPLLETQHDTVVDCLGAERSLFHMDHCQAGLWLTQRWGFPSEHSRVAGCHHNELHATTRDPAALSHAACLLADALGFCAVAVAQAPSAAEVFQQLPSSPWHPYVFNEEELKRRITKQIAAMEAI